MHRRHLLASVSALGALATLPAAVRAQGRRLVLGQSVPLTGPAAQLGIQMQAGAKLFFDAQNAAGGGRCRARNARARDAAENRADAGKDKLVGFFRRIGLVFVSHIRSPISVCE